MFRHKRSDFLIDSAHHNHEGRDKEEARMIFSGDNTWDLKTLYHSTVEFSYMTLTIVQAGIKSHISVTVTFITVTIILLFYYYHFYKILNRVPRLRAFCGSFIPLFLLYITSWESWFRNFMFSAAIP